MRRFMLTLTLSGAAVAAALLAPRLVPEMPVRTVRVVEPAAIPELGLPPAREPAPIASPPPAAIPEVRELLPPPPKAPAAVPDDFWIDAYDCGMG